MLLQEERDRVRMILKDTIKLLCRNSLHFKNKFSIEAVIGVTLDEDEVFLISMNEVIESRSKERDPVETSSSDKEVVGAGSRPHRKRARVRDDQSASFSATEELDSDIQMDGSAVGSDRLGDAPTSGDVADFKPKEEPAKGSSDDDLIFVKQEVDDSWLQTSVPGEQMDSSRLSQNCVLEPDGFSVSGGRNSAAPSKVQDGEAWIHGISTSNHQPAHPEGGQTASQTKTDQFSSHTTDEQNPVLYEEAGLLEFVCTICQKPCSNRSNLRRHERAHCGIYPYKCSVCGKGFFSQDNRKAHMYLHTGEKQFTCYLCKEKFRYKEMLRYHMDMQHTNT